MNGLPKNCAWGKVIVGNRDCDNSLTQILLMTDIILTIANTIIHAQHSQLKSP